MGNELDPIVGNWYRHLDKGQMFTVVALDEQSGLLELQHYDGNLEEVAVVAWPDMDLELAAAPEDWTGPVEVEEDDTGYSETAMSSADWRESLQETTRTPGETWEDTRPEYERDESGQGAITVETWDPQRVESTVSAPIGAEESVEPEDSESGS